MSRKLVYTCFECRGDLTVKTFYLLAIKDWLRLEESETCFVLGDAMGIQLQGTWREMDPKCIDNKQDIERMLPLLDQLNIPVENGEKLLEQLPE